MPSTCFLRAKDFILTHARLLERVLFQVYFEGRCPSSVATVIRGYQNPDGGLGHALEPDLRCPESQPLFVAFGLELINDVSARDQELALDICNYLEAISAEDGLVPIILESALQSPRAAHWNATGMPALNPTVSICGCLLRQEIRHPWLTRATQTCCELLAEDAPREAHTLQGATRLIDSLPDRALAGRLFDIVADTLPKASFYIADAPTHGYGLTPLHFAPTPTSPWRELFTDDQINGHLDDLAAKQQPDGGWPVTWAPPGPAATNEWRGHVTLQAVRTLAAYGRL